MFSIICCSVHPEAAAALERNIAATIGVPFELIAFNNRELGYGLYKVYNRCATRAKYDYPCFAHEGICFATQGLGNLIAKL